MLSDADDFPALVAELAADAFVAGHVFFAFAVPEGTVGFGTGVALGASRAQNQVCGNRRGRLPKVAPKGWHRLRGSKCHQPSVDEDGVFLFRNRGLARWPLGKSKVGLSGQR